MQFYRTEKAYCRSQNVDQEHEHIITGYLCIISDNKLRKTFCKGPKFRESIVEDIGESIE